MTEIPTDEELGRRVGEVLRELYPERQDVRIGTPGHRSSRRIPQLVTATICVLALAVALVLVRGRHESSAPPADSSTTSTPSTLPTPSVSGDRLTAPISYADGSLRLAPLPQRYVPAVSREHALDLINDHYPHDSGPTVLFLASYTSYERSSKVDPTSGAIVPNLESVPVWVLLVQVPVRDATMEQGGHMLGPLSAGHVSGVPTPTSTPPTALPPVRTEDELILIDADTGAIRDGLVTTVADPVASTAPEYPDLGKPSR